MQQPCIIENSPANEWKAIQTWTPSYLIKHHPTFKQTQVHRNRTFSYFKEDKPLASLEEVQQKYKGDSFKRADVSSSEFFEIANSITRPDQMFYYSVISFDDISETLKSDLHPLEPLIAVPPSMRSSVSNLNISNSSNHRLTTLWVGPSGATTRLHYDSFDNFYIQIYGRKRFVIFPPEQHRSFYLNAYWHSGAQQAQVDIDNIDLDTFPLFKAANGMDAILNPGDVLFLPALWFHHVIALDTSFSCSIWSRNEQVIPMWKAEKAKLPIRSTWPSSKLAYAGLVYMKELHKLSFSDLQTENSKLSSELLHLTNFNEYIKDIWTQRFRLLVQQIPSLSRESMNDPNEFCNLKDKNDSSDSNKDAMLSDTDVETMKKSAKEISILMLKVKSPLTRSIWVANFLERLSLPITSISKYIAYIQSLVECNDLN